jgi:hypothetical protein
MSTMARSQGPWLGNTLLAASGYVDISAALCPRQGCPGPGQAALQYVLADTRCATTLGTPLRRWAIMGLMAKMSSMGNVTPGLAVAMQKAPEFVYIAWSIVGSCARPPACLPAACQPELPT